MWKIKGGEVLPPAKLCSDCTPMEPSSDHQVQDQPQIPFHTDRDTLPDSPQLANFAAFHTRQRRFHRSKQEHICEADSLDGLREDALFKGRDVSGDVGQLRHASTNRCSLNFEAHNADYRIESGFVGNRFPAGMVRGGARRLTLRCKVLDMVAGNLYPLIRWNLCDLRGLLP